MPQNTHTSLQGLIKSLPEYLSPSSYPGLGEAWSARPDSSAKPPARSDRLHRGSAPGSRRDSPEESPLGLSCPLPAPAKLLKNQVAFPRLQELTEGCHTKQTQRVHTSTHKQHMHETGGVWNGGARLAGHAQQAHARTPTPSPAGAARGARAFLPRTSPDSRVTFQVRSLSPWRRRPCVSASSPAPPSPAACGARAERWAAQRARAVRKARSAGPGLPLPPRGLRGIRGRGRARCGQELRRLGCCRLPPPRGPVQSRRARREGGKEGREQEKEGGGSAGATARKGREPASQKVGSPARAPTPA